MIFLKGCNLKWVAKVIIKWARGEENLFLRLAELELELEPEPEPELELLSDSLELDELDP